MLKQDQVYSLYKPLRNAIRKVELQDSLLVLWNYAQNISFGRTIDWSPRVLSAFRSRDVLQKKRAFAEWDIEHLVREVIINSPRCAQIGSTFRDARCLALCIAKLKTFHEEVYKLYGSELNVFDEFRRMAHQQFVWTSYAPSQFLILRYAKIYGHADLKPVFERVFGLSLHQFLVASMAAFGFFCETSPALPLPPQVIGIRELSTELVERFFSFFSLPFDTLKTKLANEQQLSENYAFAYSSLRADPLIEMEWDGRPHIVCPMPILFLWAVTQGVYYRLTAEPGLDHAIGTAFESYVGDVLEQVGALGRPFTVVREREFKSETGHRRGVDWVMADASAALFVECKTKRLVQKAKEDLVPPDAMYRDLDRLAEAVVQVYKFTEQYGRGNYPAFTPEPDLRVFPIVVTMEEWYLIGPEVRAYVRDKVLEGLRDHGISESRLDEMPYTTCSIGEFEGLCQLLQVIPIGELMHEWTTSAEYDEWQFDAFVRDRYGERFVETKGLFADEFRRLMGR